MPLVSCEHVVDFHRRSTCSQRTDRSDSSFPHCAGQHGALQQWLANVSFQGPGSKYLRLCGPYYCYSHPALRWSLESSYQRQVNEQVRLCFNRILLTKTGNWRDLAPVPWFAGPCLGALSSCASQKDKLHCGNREPRYLCGFIHQS